METRVASEIEEKNQKQRHQESQMKSLFEKKEKSLLDEAKRQDEMQTEKYTLVRFTFKGILFKLLVTWQEQFQWNGRSRKLRGE